MTSPICVYFMHTVQRTYNKCRTLSLLLRWGETVCGTAACSGPFVHPTDDTRVNVEQQWNYTDRENRRTRRKTCPSATFSTTNPTFTALGTNPVLCGEKPATNRLSYGTAMYNTLKYIVNISHGTKLYFRI
jgi:hypothetical protein